MELYYTSLDVYMYRPDDIRWFCVDPLRSRAGRPVSLHHPHCWSHWNGSLGRRRAERSTQASVWPYVTASSCWPHPARPGTYAV